MAICLEQGCPIQVQNGRCPKHALEHEQKYERNRHDEPFRHAQRTWRWTQYSKRWLDRHPFCGERADGERHPDQSRCTREGLIVAARVTDHIIPTSKGGSMWNPKNHQSLCVGCNNSKGDVLPDSNDGAWAKDDASPVFG
jgi:5-methylcytosine-specific restriction endonuclease McrA